MILASITQSWQRVRGILPKSYCKFRDNYGRTIKFFLVWLVFFLIFPFRSWAIDLPLIPEFTKDDRVLILAPHPDDEALGAGGVIQRARGCGAKVRVVCYTNGDHNELAFIVYEKRFTFRTGEFLHMGQLRGKETIAAMTSLGLLPQDLIFLGYPDFGTMAILTQFWQSKKSYQNLLTRISKVSYADALSPGAPYVGESILKDLKTVIKDFQPTKIFVSHPADTNNDHQSLYLFTKIALWDLEGEIIQPVVYPYLIHVIGWPKPRGHHLDLALKPPDKLTEVSWRQLRLSSEETKRKQALVDFYKTEIEYNPPYLYTYVRQNELFGDFSVVDLENNSRFSSFENIIWRNLVLFSDCSLVSLSSASFRRDGPRGGVAEKNGQEENHQVIFSGLSYALQDAYLLVRLDLRRKIDKNLGVSMYFLGYKKNIPFEVVPKINVRIGLWGMRIRNKTQLISLPDAQLKFFGRSLILKLPLAALGAPDRILSRVKTRTAKFPLDASAWRILRIK